MGAASGAATGDRLPLLVYRVNVDDGTESLIRGARLAGLTLRAIRNIAGVGSDATPFNFTQSQQAVLPEPRWLLSVQPIPAFLQP